MGLHPDLLSASDKSVVCPNYYQFVCLFVATLSLSLTIASDDWMTKNNELERMTKIMVVV
jgi:hypothetical protein